MAFSRAQAVTVVWLSLAAFEVSAQVDPDTEVARRQYRAGAAAYERGDYEQALQAFQLAQEARRLPELDFNIGKCFDRLGRWPDAADAYERYLTAKPNAPEVGELRDRIRDLRQRRALVTAPPPSSRPTSLRLAAWLTGAGALVAAAAGAGVYGAMYSDYAARRDACQGRCAPSSYGDLRTEVQNAQIGSGILFAVAGALVVTDVVLWVRDRRVHSAVHARLGAAGLRF